MSNHLASREFYLTDNMQDKNVSKKKVLLNITKTLPIIIANEDLITNSKLLEHTTPTVLPVNLKCYITDPDYANLHGEDRFIYITSIYSHTTNNINLLYYDKMFEDIIIIPNMEYLDTIDIHTIFKINGYRLGTNENTSDREVIMSLPIKDSTAIKLPVTNENIVSKSLLCNIPGSHTENNGRSNSIEVLKNGTYNLTYMETPPVTVVDLGLFTDLFADTKNIPTYLLHGISPNVYGLHYLNTMDVSTNRLYIAMRF